MLKWIGKEIKISFKSTKNIILLVMVFFTMFAYISNEKVLSSKEETSLSRLSERVLYYDNLSKTSCEWGAGKRDYCESNKHMLNWSTKQLNAYIDNDSEFYHRFNFSLSYKLIENNLPIFESMIKENDDLFGDAVKIRINDSRRLIDNNKEYYIEEFGENTWLVDNVQISSVNELLESVVNMEYQLKLIENDIGIIENHQITPGTFFINYIQSFGMFLFMIILLINFDMISSDFDNGTIKTFISTPKGRLKYFIVKIISSIITSLVILLGPIIVVTMSLSAMQGISTFKHPAFYYQNGLFSYEQMVGYATSSSQGNYVNVSDYSEIRRYGPTSNVLLALSLEKNFKHLLNVTEILSIIILILLYILLIIVFIVVLSYVFGILINKAIPTFISLLGLFLGSTLISNISLGSTFFKLNPFSYMRISRIIEGTLPTSYLFGIVVLSISSISLLLISYFLTKRKNIYV